MVRPHYISYFDDDIPEGYPNYDFGSPEYEFFYFTKTYSEVLIAAWVEDDHTLVGMVTKDYARDFGHLFSKYDNLDVKWLVLNVRRDQVECKFD